MQDTTRTSGTIDPTRVKGWGIDADEKNDPTYPMKKRNNAEHAGYTWQRPVQQPADVEVLHSNERPNLTSVFGTSTPPKGLSGMLRRVAFRHSESTYAHWLPLIVADRIGIVEGVLDDLVHGHVPNVFAERGWNADWQHDRKRLLGRLGIAALVATAAVVLVRSRSATGRLRRP